MLPSSMSTASSRHCRAKVSQQKIMNNCRENRIATHVIGFRMLNYRQPHLEANDELLWFHFYDNQCRLLAVDIGS